MAHSDQHHLAYNAQEIRPGVWRHAHCHEPVTSAPRSAHEHEHVRGPAADDHGRRETLTHTRPHRPKRTAAQKARDTALTAAVAATKGWANLTVHEVVTIASQFERYLTGEEADDPTRPQPPR